MPLNARLKQQADKIEAALETALAEKDLPKRLKDAMSYAVLGGGKRVRPFLVLEIASLYGADEKALSSALAIEAIHCYSLAHDDLPAMDDDDLRRGRPSLHKAFDEATAILAGDALLTLGFDLIANDNTLSAESRVALTALLAKTAGGEGMVGGQMLDLAAEGRFEAAQAPLSAEEILHLQALKTGALFRFSCLAGAMAADAPESDLTALSHYAHSLGLAFQISDDILDATGSSEEIGKTAGKDAKSNKGTLVSLWGLEKTRAALQTAIEDGQTALEALPYDTGILAELLAFMATRKS